MALGRAEAAGTQGFNQYTAPRIAELSANEQAGIGAAGSQAGMYQPVVNMAMQSSQDLMNNATPDATQFINPYVNYVLGNSLDRLQEQSDINMTKIGSTAGMSGAFGGLRHGVLEGANLGELLKSARDLSGSTYADAYDKGMNTWFRAQDNQRANISGAIQNVQGAQNYNTGDIQRLMSTGLTERTRNQAGLDFGYSEFMREDQDDLNKASFLSTIAAQYPRDLFTKTNTTETTQSDSPIKTLAGIGLAAAGIMSGNPAALAGLGAGASALGQQTTDRPGAPVNKIATGGLIKGYANGGMVKAGLGMMAGMDPLEATMEYLDQAKEDGQTHGLGGLMTSSRMNRMADFDEMDEGERLQRFGSKGSKFIQGYRDSKGLTKQPQVLPAVQPRQAFDWDTFLQNMNFNSFTRPSQNTVNPSYGAPSSMPQFNQTYTPMSQQRVPLAPGIPGPGGPMGLQGNTLQRPEVQGPVNQPLSVYAKGGFVSPQRKDSSKSVPMLDPKTLDILGKLLEQQSPPELGNQDAIRRQYEQHMNPNPPMPDWMKDPEMIRMMQETFGQPPLRNSSVPQFDSFQDVIDGKQSGYAGGGKVGPGDGWELNVPEDDKGHYDILRMLGLDKRTLPQRGFQDVIRNDYPRYGDELGDLSYLNEDMKLIKNIQKQEDYVKRKPLLKNNDATEERLKKVGAAPKSNNPLDAMITTLAKDVAKAKAMNELSMQMGEPLPFDEADVRKEDALRYLNDSGRAFPQELIDAKRLRKEYEYLPGTPLEELTKRRLTGPGRASKYDNKDTRAYQEGGFVQGGKSFEKNQARVPAEMVDPLAALYHGMDSSAGKFQPDFQNLGRDDVLGKVDSVGEGTITKAQARNQTSRAPQDIIDSLPMDPNADPSRVPRDVEVKRYSNSKMWDNVNEDLFVEGTKMNEQDNSIKNKDLSKNDADMTLAGTHAFTPFQYTADTWNGYVKKVPKAVREQLNIRPVNKQDIYKYKSGDPELAKYLPSAEAAAYVYKNFYLPTSYNTLKKAGLPITEMNLYLAHHLGPDGAVKAIPTLYDKADKPMKDILVEVGLKSAAKSKGNPWTKKAGYTFNDYRADKEKAYNNLREKYSGKTIDEMLAERGAVPQNDPSRGGETISGGTTTFNPIDIIGDSFTKGGMGFAGGGLIKKFSKGGGAYSSDSQIFPLEDWDEVFRRQYGDDSLVLPLESWDSVMPPPPDVTADEIDLYRSIPKGNKADLTSNKVNVIGSPTVTTPKKQPREPNVLRMPENPADWKTREPGVFEKARERAKDPNGIGRWDDFLSQIPGLGITPSTSGRVPTDQKIVLPIDEKGWDYKPNPNLYMDALGEWGNSGDPVDNFYNEMSDMIGTPQGGAPEIPAGAQADPTGGTGGGPGAPGGDVVDDDPEAAMLRQLYKDRLREYMDAQTKPKKQAVFGMFDNVNEPLLKLGLSILASKGSFGNALGEAGLASLADRDKEQLKKGQEASEKLQEIVKMRYTNAMVDSLDPNVKAELARQAQAAKLQEKEMQLDFERQKAGLTAKETRVNEILKAIMRWQTDRVGEPVPQEWLDIVNNAGYGLKNPEEEGTSLFN